MKSSMVATRFSGRTTRGAVVPIAATLEDSWPARSILKTCETVQVQTDLRIPFRGLSELRDKAQALTSRVQTCLLENNNLRTTLSLAASDSLTRLDVSRGLWSAEENESRLAVALALLAFDEFQSKEATLSEMDWNIVRTCTSQMGSAVFTPVHARCREPDVPLIWVPIRPKEGGSEATCNEGVDGGGSESQRHLISILKKRVKTDSQESFLVSQWYEVEPGMLALEHQKIRATAIREANHTMLETIRASDEKTIKEAISGIRERLKGAQGVQGHRTVLRELVDLVNEDAMLNTGIPSFQGYEAELRPSYLSKASKGMLSTWIDVL